MGLRASIADTPIDADPNILAADPCGHADVSAKPAPDGGLTPSRDLTNQTACVCSTVRCVAR
jgi:hypothetical protein